MNIQFKVGAKSTRWDLKRTELFFVVGGLLVVEVVSLAPRFYLLSEALLVIAFAALFSLAGTSLLLLVFLIHGMGR